MEFDRLPRTTLAALLLVLTAWGLPFPAAHVSRAADGNGSTAGPAEDNGTPPKGHPGAYRRESEDIQRRIRNQRQQLDAAARRETDILSQLDRLDREIQELRAKSDALAEEIDQVDRQLLSAQEAADDLKSRIRAGEGIVARRLVAWYKLKRLGEIHLLASADSLAGYLRRKAALEKVLAYDADMRQQMLQHQNELKQVVDTLALQRQAKQQRAAEKRHQLTLLAQRRETRASLLAEVRRRKDLQEAALEALQRAAGRLDSKMATLSRDAVESNDAHAAAPQPLAELKGLLNMPVEGKITNSFGPYRNTTFNVTNFRSGIDILTDKGEPVRAVHDGRILYASWFKGYGNMVIIDHGASYYTVYAHVEEIFKSIGDRVESGDVIATVGDTGSMTGARLYFELRHHGKPLDPLDWLK